jgi:hypothetical protein
MSAQECDHQALAECRAISNDTICNLQDQLAAEREITGTLAHALHSAKEENDVLRRELKEGK